MWRIILALPLSPQQVVWRTLFFSYTRFAWKFNLGSTRQRNPLCPSLPARRPQSDFAFQRTPACRGHTWSEMRCSRPRGNCLINILPRGNHFMDVRRFQTARKLPSRSLKLPNSRQSNSWTSPLSARLLWVFIGMFGDDISFSIQVSVVASTKSTPMAACRWLRPSASVLPLLHTPNASSATLPPGKPRQPES